MGSTANKFIVMNLKKSAPPTAILLVCMGNICRSPLAEAVLRYHFLAAGLGASIQLDSAGTLGAHAGSPPDKRAQQVAADHGYDLSKLRARRVVAEDFQRFDLIMAMDADNLHNLQQMRADWAITASCAELDLFLRHAGVDGLLGAQEVPDPYYGPLAGFERVLHMCETAARSLVQRYA